MGEMIELKANDGHPFSAYRARPDGKPRGGLVIIQEVFGLTDHIKRVTDDYAGEGYLSVAPALFDRVEPGITLSYDDVEKGRDVMLQLDVEDVIRDVGAAAAVAEEAGPVGAVGYCWGGAIADLAACRLPIKVAVAYYGGRMTSWLDLKPGCPVLYHFGGQDPLIPTETIQQIRGARPDGVIYLYPEAGHGFNCDERADFHPVSAEQARDRSLAVSAAAL